MIVLDFGCSTNKIDHALGVDIDIRNHPDLVFDLNRFPYPLKESSVDRIYAKHILEHLNDLYAIFREVHRVLKPDGDFIVEVPHYTSPASYAEPEHNRYFSYFMFDKLIKGISCRVLKRELTFYKTFRMAGIKFLANKFPDVYERFWGYLFPAENVCLHLKMVK